MSFPRDDYTPFGYLANPAARATSWGELHGGTLRTPNDVVGMGWQYPWDRHPTAAVEVALRLTVGERVYAGRDDGESLTGMTGKSYGELDAEYREFLESLP